MPKSSVLRPEFLKTILLREPYRSAVTYKFVRIVGAWFVEPVDLSDATLTQGLWLVDCTFLKDVTLDQLKFSPFLNLKGSKFRGRLSMNSMKAGGRLLIGDGAEFEEVDLRSAKIDGGVEMVHSKFGGKLDMNGMNVGGRLLIGDGAEFEEVDLRSAKIDGDVDMYGSQFGGKLDMNGMNVGGRLLIGDGAEFAEVDLRGAKIEGLVEIYKSQFGGRLDLNGMNVGGYLLMRDTAELAEVDLRGAKVDGDAEMCGSQFGGKLDMNGMKVGGYLIIGDGAKFAEVDLRSAKIDRDVEILGSQFGGKLNMSGMNVGGFLSMRDGAEFEEVDLRSAKIDRDVDISGSRFGGKLEMNGGKVGGRLIIRDGAEFTDRVSMILSRIEWDLSISGGVFHSLDLAGTHVGGEFALGSGTRWGIKDSKLTLRNTEVGTLQDSVDSWPPNLELDGFKYGRLGGSGGDEKCNMGYRDIDWLKREWLEKQKTYAPQPYEQLADILTKVGFQDKATEILFTKKEREQKEAWDRQQWWSWFWLAAQRHSIGYGYHIFWSLRWVGAFLAAGWLIVMCTFQGRCKGRLWCFIYSLDLLLPIIQLDKRNYDTHLGGWAKYYFYVHKIFGYVLASFIIAGISGLTKQ